MLTLTEHERHVPCDANTYALHVNVSVRSVPRLFQCRSLPTSMFATGPCLKPESGSGHGICGLTAHFANAVWKQLGYCFLSVLYAYPCHCRHKAPANSLHFGKKIFERAVHLPCETKLDPTVLSKQAFADTGLQLAGTAHWCFFC